MFVIKYSYQNWFCFWKQYIKEYVFNFTGKVTSDVETYITTDIASYRSCLFRSDLTSSYPSIFISPTSTDPSSFDSVMPITVALVFLAISPQLINFG